MSWSPPLHVLTSRRADHGLLHCSVTSEFLLLPVSCHLATSCSHWPHLSPLTGHRSCCLNFPPVAQMCDLTPKGDPMSSGCCGEPQGTGGGEWPHPLAHLRALPSGALPPALGTPCVTGMAAQRPHHLQGLSYCHPLLLHRLLGRAASGRVQSTIVGGCSAEASFKPRAAITVCRMGTQRDPHLHTVGALPREIGLWHSVRPVRHLLTGWAGAVVGSHPTLETSRESPVWGARVWALVKNRQ